jgi:hypothetical protein
MELGRLEEAQPEARDSNAPITDILFSRWIRNAAKKEMSFVVLTPVVVDMVL